jgi:hypothetical protein
MPTATRVSGYRGALDMLAIGLSGLCLVHCLAMPLVIVALPTLGLLAREHWIHQVLIGMAAPVSLWAVIRSGLWRRPSVGLPMSAGLALLATAAFYPPVEPFETPFSITGALLLALAHFGDARLMHRRRECPQGSEGH